MSAEKRRGRGAASNPANRFETLSYHSSDWDEPEDPAPQTLFLKDDTRTIINYNDSPDVGFSASINPYRGCEHGCIYCFARPNHEYLGFSAGLDFESKILVKENAPDLLRRELLSPKWAPQVIAIDRKSTRLNSSHGYISYAVFCLKKKKNNRTNNDDGSQTRNCHTDP